VGSAPDQLAAELRDSLLLERAVETGTYLGDGARTLAGIFASVVSIELSEQYHRRATEALAGIPKVRLIYGDSREELRRLARERVPTFYFLDGHWSGGDTAGEGSECPVVAEIAALAEGHPRDCVVIDDARLFAAAPPPPHDPHQWPTLIEVFAAIRGVRPDHHVTLLHDQVIAVPAEARPIVDRFGQSAAADAEGARATPSGWRRLAAAFASWVRPGSG
jgi:hypothetical protein